jgi:hypothetical protein
MGRSLCRGEVGEGWGVEDGVVEMRWAEVGAAFDDCYVFYLLRARMVIKQT